LDETQAMIALIGQSPGILVDRSAAEAQLEVLRLLVKQTQSYRIFLGVDVYERPTEVADLLCSAQRGE
jgi:hypothetical protein